MAWQFNPYAVLILFGLLPLIYFVYRAYQQRATLAARLFMLSSIVSVGTLAVYVLELLSATPEGLLLWVQMRFVLSIFLPALGLLFILAYLGMDEWVTWKNGLLLSIVPVIRLIAVWTNDSYHLQWSSYTTQQVGTLLFARYQDASESPIFWMGQLYFLIVAGLTAFVIRRVIIRSPGMLQGQVVYLLFAILLPASGILLEVIGIHPLPNINFPVLTLCLTVIPLGLALFRYRLLDLMPAAQSLVLQSMQDAVVVVDLQGRIVQANPAAIAFRNVQAEAMIGHTIEEVYADLPHLVERFDKVFAAQEIIEVKGRDQTMRYFDLRISPLRNRGGQTTGRILVLRDVSVHKQAEQQAIDLALERERTVLLKSFISDTSHDIMTPIAAMRISTYLLRTLTDKISLVVTETKTNPKNAMAALSTLETTVNAIRDKSTNLDASALRLQSLIESMMEMVKLDTQVFDFTRDNFNQLVEEAVNLQRFLAEQKGVQLNLDLESGLPKIDFDSNQFMRVLQNLLTNALKYTARGGSVTIHTRQQDEWVVLEIQDSGQGIPADNLPHIFERLYRVDKSRTVEAGGVGLGLGLAIAKTIIEAHQGRVEVESTVGVGSLFRVVLPMMVGIEQLGRPSDLQIA